MEVKIGIRELRAQLSRYLDQVKQGAVIVITEHGRPIARIVPEGQPHQIKMQELLAGGVLAWSGRPLRPAAPAALIHGRRTVADLLLEDRG
ncbi:MAG: type II toxin-antitoxin system Phd/YefM family antitoxin [Candidatus Methylomirabilales bacterium]